MDLETCKQRAAEKAVTFVKDGMVVGLGTGSTAAYFIQALGAAAPSIHVVASSKASLILAEQCGLKLQDPTHLTSIDLYVDGADEIDPEKQMIKGAGGALLREKILSHMSLKTLIIVDESKLVPKLGIRPLPVEIVPFCADATIHHLKALGYSGTFRTNDDRSLYFTDNHNHLYDIQLPTAAIPIAQHHARISVIPGVVDTGFFEGRRGEVVIGFKDGSVVVQ